MLKRGELKRLIDQVFKPKKGERRLALLVDLPASTVPENSEWRQRRELAAHWMQELSDPEAGLQTSLYLFSATGADNAELPNKAWKWNPDTRLPNSAESRDPVKATAFDRIFQEHSMLMALTEFSATAPLKLAAREFRFRAATMGGFSVRMVDALRVDYDEVSRRVNRLKALLDGSDSACLTFQTPLSQETLRLDLRNRTGHASTGLLREAGTAGNLPSGEAYIVPYEGELTGRPSVSEGHLPVYLEGEVITYRIVRNRAVGITGEGTVAARERDRLEAEPAYGNIAELGLGVLADFGIAPCGSILLDEKLGLHLAFGRSDHFGGQIGPGDFSTPSAVVHIDRVYLPSLQPGVEVLSLDLISSQSEKLRIMEQGSYTIDWEDPA